MASVAVNKLSVAEKDQLAVSYASFVLLGVGAQVTTDSLRAVIKAAGLTVQDSLIDTFGKNLKGKKTTDLLGGKGQKKPAKQAESKKKSQTPKQVKKETKKEVPPPPPPPAQEEQMDIGGMFD